MIKLFNRNKEQNRNKKYISYNTRILITFMLSFVFLFCSLFLILSSFDVIKLEEITYKEKSPIDYKIYLKENDFFTDEYISKNDTRKTYIANLIKNITLDFDYQFEIDKPTNMEISYKVIGKLVISNPKDNSVYYEEPFTLVEEKKDTIIDSSSYSINKTVVIDYDSYNNLANKFRYNFGLETESYLDINLIIKGKTNDDSEFNINIEGVKASLKIPLSEKAINIKLEEKALNEQKNVLANKHTKLNNRYKFIIGILFLVITILLVLYLLKLLSFLRNKKSKYDKYIKKILREYDRLIINTKTAPILDGHNIIKLDNFQELLDARDNVKGAIKYYVVTEHQKCNFYFTHNNDLYLLVIKAIDIEKN